MAIKTDIVRWIIFLGPQCTFPGPGSDMLLRISLQEKKKNDWPNRIAQFPASGSISH